MFWREVAWWPLGEVWLRKFFLILSRFMQRTWDPNGDFLDVAGTQDHQTSYICLCSLFSWFCIGDFEIFPCPLRPYRSSTCSFWTRFPVSSQIFHSQLSWRSSVHALLVPQNCVNSLRIILSSHPSRPFAAILYNTKLMCLEKKKQPGKTSIILCSLIQPQC